MRDNSPRITAIDHLTEAAEEKVVGGQREKPRLGH
jgi:hypothetical protein